MDVKNNKITLFRHPVSRKKRIVNRFHQDFLPELGLVLTVLTTVVKPYNFLQQKLQQVLRCKDFSSKSSFSNGLLYAVIYRNL